MPDRLTLQIPTVCQNCDAPIGMTEEALGHWCPLVLGRPSILAGNWACENPRDLDSDARVSA